MKKPDCLQAVSIEHPPQHRTGQAGFTLYEMLITLTIVGVLTAFGSGVYGIVHEHRVSAEINQFIAHLSLARSESLKRSAETALCPSTNGRECDTTQNYRGWHNGALVFVDADGDGRLDLEDTIIRVLPPTQHIKINSTRGRSHIVFQPNGLAPGTNRTLVFCSAGSNARPRYVVMSNTGRARVASTPPHGSTSAALGCA